MMWDLSDSAVQFVAQLVNSDNSKISTDTRQYLEHKSSEANYNFSNFNLSSKKARHILKEYGVT